MNNRTLALVLALTLAPIGCKNRKTAQVQATLEEAPQLASLVHMGDPKAEVQLINGFYGIEQNSWRWTGRQFSVVLRPPFGAAQRGARLELSLTVPGVVIDKLKTVSLSAMVDGHALPPESYTQDGQFVYKRDLPPELVAGESTRVDFQLDKAIPPTGSDQRELGLVVLSVALQPK